MGELVYFSTPLPAVERCARIALALFCAAIAVLFLAGIVGTIKLFAPATPEPAYLIIVGCVLLLVSFALFERPRDSTFDTGRF